MSVENKGSSKKTPEEIRRKIIEIDSKERKRIILQEGPEVQYSSDYTKRSRQIRDEIRKTFKTSKEKIEQNTTSAKKPDPSELPPDYIRQQFKKIAKIRKEKNLVEKSKVKGEKELEELLKATHEYKYFHYKPGVEAKYWQAYWNYYGVMTGHEIKVPKYEGTLARKRELESKGLMLVYIPPGLSTPEALTFLSLRHPAIQGTNGGEGLTKERCKNISCEDISGWINVEVGDNTPRTETTEKELKEQIESDKRIGMNLIVYIISSYNYQKVAGKYLDTKPWVRLLGSTLNGKVIDAGFRPDGSLCIDIPNPDTIDESLGGRSVKKEENLNS